MKKGISILVLFAVIATGAFAQIQKSVGAGLVFDYSGNNGVEYTAPSSLGGGDYYAGIANVSIGGFVFFDITYAEIDVSFAYGSLGYIVETPLGNESEAFGNILQLGFSVLGKYPIGLGPVTLFPLLGLGYNLVLSGSYDDEYGGGDIKDAGDYSQFGLLFGVGLDINLPASLYLRLEALFNLRFAAKAMDDAATEVKDASFGLISPETTLGMGPRIKLALGYKF